MARSLVQSINVPATVDFNTKHAQLRGSTNNRRMVKMICNFQSPRLRTQAPPLTLRGFSGLRGSNALDTLVMPGLDFHSKMAVSMNAPRGRGSRCVAKAMFERFTEKAIKVIMLAQEEARRLGHNFVGTEQILLGLIGEGTGIAAKVLKSMGINLKDARVEVEKVIGRGSGFVAVEIPFTPRAKRVLELSLEEARQLGNKVNFAQKISWFRRALVVNSGYIEAESEPNTPFKENTIDIQLPRRSLLVQFTCNDCGNRTERHINRNAYERGTVYVQCAGCLKHHTLVDNLNLVVEYNLLEDSNADSND